jgi:hypothetical protein
LQTKGKSADRSLLRPRLVSICFLFVLAVLSIAKVVAAYEYRLQFSAAAGARSIMVAGYYYIGSAVGGDCSYYTQGACSGRGCRPPPPVYYYDTCTWDLFGNLLTETAGAPTPPAPLYTSGTEIVYANGFLSNTGKDTRNFGFVATPSAHYSWQTVNGGYTNVPDAQQTIAVTLISDGDYAVNFDAANVTAQIYGTITPASGNASVTGNTCVGGVAPGSTCTVTVTYDPTVITCTGSPYGYAYTGIDLSLIGNAGSTTDFTQRFTVTGVPICND